MSIRFNTTRWNTAQWNGLVGGITPTVVMKILYNQRSISLQWTAVPGATSYAYEVSLFHDFRTIFESGTQTPTAHTFTDNEADDAKRFWRWRALVSGVPIEPWSEVGSYWIDTSATEEIFLNNDTWAMFAPDDVEDFYLFSLFPRYRIIAQNLYRIQERNRGGTLLSEFLTIKGDITLMFAGSQFLEHEQFHEMVRFHTEIRTIFLASMKQGEKSRQMPHIWKCEFRQDPSFTMISAGRQDLLAGQLQFEEV